MIRNAEQVASIRLDDSNSGITLTTNTGDSRWINLGDVTNITTTYTKFVTLENLESYTDKMKKFVKDEIAKARSDGRLDDGYYKRVL